MVKPQAEYRDQTIILDIQRAALEAGDVEWASHDSNLDNAIGPVNSGDTAGKVVSDWGEQPSKCQRSLMIVTADHGHDVVLERRERMFRWISESMQHIHRLKADRRVLTTSTSGRKVT